MRATDPVAARQSTVRVWTLASLPAALLLIGLLVPALRQHLLVDGMPAGPVVSTASVGRPPAADPRPAPPPAVAIPAARPVEPPTERRPAPQPTSSTGVRAISGEELGAFLEEVYRPYLPAAAGPIRASAEGDRLTLESQIDLEMLASETGTELPAAVKELEEVRRGFTGRDRVSVRVAGRLISSSGGIARLRLEQVRVAGIPLPEQALSRFVAEELEARGLVAEDPLVRPFYLPGGWESASVADGRLLLRAR